MSFVRQSKFRHVFGKASSGQYTNVKISKNSADSSLCAVNPKFLAVCCAGTGGGPFLVLPLAKVGRLETDYPLVNGHTQSVIDLAWSPFNDNVIASCSDDCTVKIWEIPEHGLTKTLDEPVIDLLGHEKRVNILLWHPTASNILASACSGGKIIIWHVEASEAAFEMNFDTSSFVTSMSWNEDGSLLAATLKDKRLLVIDIRAEKIIAETEFCTGFKPGKCVFVDKGRIFTTGFTKMSTRVYALWDSKNLKSPLTEEEIDQGNGVLYPYYDASNKIVFTAGKGDADIKYYELTHEEPYVHFLAAHRGERSQRGVAFMPKRACNVVDKEIARFYKLCQRESLCEGISMIVPRKSDTFQEDIYPDCPGDEPSMTAEEWISGKNACSKLMSWKNVYTEMKGKSGSTNTVTSSKPQRSLSKLPQKPVIRDRGGEQNGTQLPEGFNLDALIEDVQKLKATVRKQNRRIAKLEKQLGDVVGDEDGKDDCEEEEE